MIVTLICGSLSNLRITVHSGRKYTNALADEIDKYPWYTVFGTIFCSGYASIHFTSKGCRREDVANTVAHCMELMFDNPCMHIEMKKVKSGKE